MNWLRTNWAIVSFALTVLFGGGYQANDAWSQQQVRIQNAERTIDQLSTENKEQKIIREQVIRQDEQLKAIKESQKTQEQLLREVLTEQRAINRKVAR